MKNRKEFVKILIEKVQMRTSRVVLPACLLIHATARIGNFEVLQLLLEKKIIDTSLKYNKERTILHWLAGVGERKSGDKEKIEK